MEFLNTLVLFVIIGIVHTLLHAHFTRHKEDKRFDTAALKRGGIALLSGILLFFLSGSIVNTLAACMTTLFSPSDPSLPGSLPVSDTLKNILRTLADSMLLMALFAQALLMAGASVIMASAGKKQYIFIGTLFYILVMALFYIGGVAIYLGGK